MLSHVKGKPGKYPRVEKLAPHTDFNVPPYGQAISTTITAIITCSHYVRIKQTLRFPDWESANDPKETPTHVN
jgi:hypothetical protein